jgi:hypothetical protein
MAKGAAINVNRPAKLTIMNTLAFIYKENGIKGLYRGVTPRIGLGVWQTICMVSLTDYVKIWLAFHFLVRNVPSTCLQGQREIDGAHCVPNLLFYLLE